MCRLAAMIFVLILPLGCAGGADTARADRSQDAAAIEREGSRWLEAVEREDAATLASIYTQDATFLPPGTPALTGRDTIRGLFETMFEAMDASYDFSIERLEVAGDWAWRWGRYRVTAVLASGDTLRVDDKFIDVWKRDADGTWRIAADIWNSNEPSPAAAGQAPSESPPDQG